MATTHIKEIVKLCIVALRKSTVNFKAPNNMQIFGRNLLWYAAVFGTVTAISRAAVTDELQVLNPEGAMSLVVQHTHYIPKRWRGKENTDKVRAEFETLFQVNPYGCCLWLLIAATLGRVHLDVLPNHSMEDTGVRGIMSCVWMILVIPSLTCLNREWAWKTLSSTSKEKCCKTGQDFTYLQGRNQKFFFHGRR